MISHPIDHIKERATHWVTQLGQGEVVQGKSTVGGGSLPGETLPTWLVALNLSHPNHQLSRLRKTFPPIIARLEMDKLVLDPRTVLIEQEGQLLTNLQKILVPRQSKLDG